MLWGTGELFDVNLFVAVHMRCMLSKILFFDIHAGIHLSWRPQHGYRTRATHHTLQYVSVVFAWLWVYVCLCLSVVPCSTNLSNDSSRISRASFVVCTHLPQHMNTCATHYTSPPPLPPTIRTHKTNTWMFKTHTQISLQFFHTPPPAMGTNTFTTRMDTPQSLSCTQWYYRVRLPGLRRIQTSESWPCKRWQETPHPWAIARVSWKV